MIESRRFYVYVVAIDGRVAYVGKGTGRRLFAHLGPNCQNPVLKDAIAAARAAQKPVRARHVKAGLTEWEALTLERKLIARHQQRLFNASLGNRSMWEVIGAQISHDLRQLKTEDQIRAEGDWNGVALEQRLTAIRTIQKRLSRLGNYAQEQLGSVMTIEKHSYNHG